MTYDNIIAFPSQIPGAADRRHSLASIQVQRLRREFTDAGKNQLEVFERLSCRIELLTLDLKKRFGDRSGKMARVFGEHYVRVAGRFTAVGGRPPRQLYRTPQAWLQIIDGFAAVQPGSPDAFVGEILEYGLYGSEDTGRSRDVTWRTELHELIDAMTDRLAREVDLRPTAEHIAGSGLYLEDGVVLANEWPTDLTGQSENEVMHSFVLGLVPHVLGLNYTPVVDLEFAATDETRSLFLNTSDLSPDSLNGAASFALKAGIRVGAAMAIHAQTGQLTFALIECQVAHLSLKDDDGRIFASRETTVDLRPLISGSNETAIGTPDSAGVWSLPENWLQNSVRFQFPGSAGFERLARSLIIKPWIWNDFEEIHFWRGDSDETEDHPVSSPVHTVAAAIESNLLYADVAERGLGLEARLDQRLLAEMRRVEVAVAKFRLAHDSRRLSRRAALLSEWRPKNTPDL